MESKDFTRWYEQVEVSKSSAPIRFTIFLVKIFPHWFLVGVCFIVAFFYYAFSNAVRNAAKIYQKKLIAFSKEGKLKKVNAYFQILSFAICLVEKIEGWSEKTNLDNVVFFDDDVVPLKEQLSHGKGAFLIGSHLGNLEYIRSLAAFNQTGVNRRVHVTAIMDMDVTANFNKSMQELNELFYFDMVSANQIGVDTIELLEKRLNDGGIIFIAGDRTSVNAPERNIKQTFLNERAEFPYGAFFLASLLKAPVYFVFPERSKDITFKNSYDMHVYKPSVDFNCPRGERSRRIEVLCSEFVKKLEYWCEKYPYQWYNFFDFWSVEKK
ncbi:MAG: hypothetical protein J6Z17_05595 [Treponema sp.]|nr:hypothetical protein [Treponema sp.]